MKGDYGVHFEDRLFLYLWYEVGNESEPTLGQHYLVGGKDPYGDCYKRIRSSLGKFKFKWDDGKIVVVKIWDATEYAKSKGLFYKNSKCDDSVRYSPTIYTTVKDTGREVHSCHYSVLDGLVTAYLSTTGQSLPICTLPTEPYNKVAEIVSALQSGNKKVLAQLPPRFWKTLTEGFVALEMGWDLCIVATYVKNVFGSFKNQLSNYSQFSGVTIVDCDSDTYQTDIKQAMKESKPVIALLSLCQGTKREERCKFLYSLAKGNRGTIVEESDMGAWKAGQVDVLKKYQTVDEIVILTTGTDGDKASALWEIDYLIECSYIDLLVNKQLAKEALHNA